MRGQGKIYQKKLVRRRRRKIFWRSFGVASLLTFLFFVTALASHLDVFALRSVQVKGASVLQVAAVDVIVKKTLSGSYGGFFSRLNSFIYPRKALEQAIASLPPVKSVSIEKENIHTVIVSLEERVETMRWCTGGLASSSPCFSVDEAGFIFAPAAASSSAFIYRGIVSNDPIGATFLPLGEWKKVGFFIQELKGANLDPREAFFENTGYVTVLLGSGGKLVVHIPDDLSNVLANIATITNDRSLAPSSKDFLETLDYLKLDTGNKVIYKAR
jgi:hypothetical protein